MKVAIISDTHWGVRNDSPIFYEYNKLFLDNQFFTYLEDNNINQVIHLGDLVDRRKYINFYTLKRLREDFLDKMCDKNITMDLICGNHDTYFKNTNDVNALDLLLKDYDNVKSYIDPQEVSVDGCNILFLPWVCKDNEKKTFELIEKTKCQIAMGHLEISGFPMFVGSPMSHGFDRKLFSKFDMVFSGHFHHRTSDGNIFYLGSHSEFMWSDCNDPRGFHIFDLETRDLTFIPNEYTIHHKFEYDENNIDLKNLEEKDFKNKIVKIIVKNKTDNFAFDSFIELLENYSPYKYQIIDEVIEINEEDLVLEAESTLDIFKKYIHSSNTGSIVKDELERVIVELYNEAIDKE